jgi:hypothetical protein
MMPKLAADWAPLALVPIQPSRYSVNCWSSSSKALVLELSLNREIEGVQILRGVAAMSVVVFHLAWQLQRIGSSDGGLSTLASGVDLFFVISGYIMVHSTAGGTNLSAREFIERRLIRIAPLYWFATAAAVVFLLLAPQFVRQTVLSSPHVIASFLFFPALHPSAPTEYAPLVYGGLDSELRNVLLRIICCGDSPWHAIPYTRDSDHRRADPDLICHRIYLSSDWSFRFLRKSDNA